MGHLIHHKNGEYAIWSTFIDDYITYPMTEEECIKYVIEEAIEDAKRTAKQDTPIRIERAKRTGTSHYGYTVDNPKDIDFTELKKQMKEKENKDG